MGETSSLIQIKGIRDGLLVTLAGAAWPDLVTAFIENIEERAAFFQGGRVVLDVGQLDLRVADLSKLRDMLSEHGVSLWAVLSESSVTERTAQNLGLATRISKPRVVEAPTVIERMPEGAAKWVKGPLRSGGRVAFDGNVVVMGDVNSGAEVVAGGSIIVWGRLRGVVHAGAQGDETAVICALDLAPTQLRIAGEIAVSPKKQKQSKSQPEVARLQDGHLEAEPWNELMGR
jgi:septum site-determining protein MinC